MSKYYKGFFKPKNPKKYKGDPTQIVYRSWWECMYMMQLDTDDKVISWSSEELIIPYRSPLDKKVHRYFPDFVVTKINKEGKRQTFVIEIKPSSQTKPPEKKQKQTKRYLTEVATWGINESKWKHAESYCKDRGWIFQILTEKELGIKN